VLGLLLFLMMYSPSSSSCTSSSSRWPRALMLPRGCTTWPSRSSTTSERRLVLDLNTTSPRFSGGTSMWMSSPKNAVLRSSLTGRENRGVGLDGSRSSSPARSQKAFLKQRTFQRRRHHCGEGRERNFKIHLSHLLI